MIARPDTTVALPERELSWPNAVEMAWKETVPILKEAVSELTTCVWILGAVCYDWQERSVITASWCTTIIVPPYDGQWLVNTGIMWKRRDCMEGGTMFKGCPLWGSVQGKDASSALERDTCQDSWRSLRLKHSFRDAPRRGSDEKNVLIARRSNDSQAARRCRPLFL
jgi:hypothetical protein